MRHYEKMPKGSNCSHICQDIVEYFYKVLRGQDPGQKGEGGIKPSGLSQSCRLEHWRHLILEGKGVDAS